MGLRLDATSVSLLCPPQFGGWRQPQGRLSPLHPLLEARLFLGNEQKPYGLDCCNSLGLGDFTIARGAVLLFVRSFVRFCAVSHAYSAVSHA